MEERKLYMRNTTVNPALTVTKQMLGKDGHFQDIAADFSEFVPSVQAMDAELAQLLA